MFNDFQDQVNQCYEVKVNNLLYADNIELSSCIYLFS